MSERPLSGTRVLDLSRLLPGPYCTLLLGDLGAEVIKVESPTAGDYARLLPRRLGGDALFAAVNRGKKSVGLDYRHPRGREILLRLAEDADVLIETFRPGAVGRWGIDYAAVSRANPRLVYCSLSGYGQDGPYRDRAGHDLNYVAVGGLLAANGVAGGPPVPPGIQLADLAGGMMAAIAILSALLARQRTGQGTYLDMSMLDTMMAWSAPLAGVLRTLAAAGSETGRGRLPLTGALPSYNVYQTADGKHLTLSALEPHFWAAFCRATGRDDLAGKQLDPAAVPEVAAIFAARPLAEWTAVFAEADACVEAVLDPEEALAHPQVRQRGLVTELATPARGGTPPVAASPFPFAPVSPDSRAPRLGEHTAEVLRRAGVSDDELGELAGARVIRAREDPRA